MSSRTEFNLLPGEASIALSRILEAPKSRVFEAWTRPEEVKRWYGLEGYTLSDCEIDLRTGGKWRLVFDGPHGRKHHVSGEYHEVAPPHRLVQTCRRDDAPHLEAMETVETLEFVESDGHTLLTSTVLHKSVDNRDKHVRLGMQDGATQILDRLAEHLEGEESQASAARSMSPPVVSARDAGAARAPAAGAKASRRSWRFLASALLILMLGAAAALWALGPGAALR